MAVTQRMTVAEYVAQDDPRRTELIDGEVVVTEPLALHQRVLLDLVMALELWRRASAGRGESTLPIDVMLDEHNCFAPDVLWYREGRGPDVPRCVRSRYRTSRPRSGRLPRGVTTSDRRRHTMSSTGCPSRGSSTPPPTRSSSIDAPRRGAELRRLSRACPRRRSDVAAAARLRAPARRALRPGAPRYGLTTAASRCASADTVTWIAAGSRTHAMRLCDCRRSSMNSKASACGREAYVRRMSNDQPVVCSE